MYKVVHMIKDVVFVGKIKNKRLISWMYIWRFILAIIVLLITEFVITNLIAYSISTLDELAVTNIGEMAIYSANVNLLTDIIFATIFLITIIISWNIIHKVVAKKVSIERQNERYVFGMVGFITGAVMLIIAITFLYEPLKSTFGLGDTLTMEEAETEFNRIISTSKDMQDLLRQGITTNSETVLASVEMFDFDVEHTIKVLSTILICNWIVAGIVFFVIICIIVVNHRKIKSIIINDSLDENGNIIPTQNKISRKSKKIIIIGVIIMTIIITFICLFVYKENHEYDFLFNDYNYNQHVLIKNSRLYHEDEINKVIEYEQTEEEPNEEWLKWRKLEHEDKWYLENPISYVEAEKYKANYPEYSINYDYASSMYDEVENFIKEIKESLNNSNDKSLSFLEQKYNVEFSHINTCTFAYILDNKNFLTGVGIEVIVDNYIDRNILDIKMWDLDGILQQIKREQEIEKLNTVNIDDKLSFIYADMSLEEVASVLGNSYIFENDVKYNSEEYTWYDENHNYIVFKFKEGKIQHVVFYKNILDI